MKLGRLHPARADALLAAVAAVAIAIELATWPAGTVMRVLALLGGVGIAATLTFRRSAPLAAIAVAQACLFVLEVASADVARDGALPYLALLFLNYSAAAHLDAPRWLAALGLAFAGVFATLLIPDARNTIDFGGVVWVGVLYLGAPFTVGRLVHARIQLNRALHEKRERLERERARRAEGAVNEERARLAAELHDIVAEAVASMVADAEAAERHAGDDPAAARRALAAVEGTGREALGELRRALGVLRREDETVALAPQPSLAHLSALVDRAGLPVTLRIEGDAVPLPAGIDLTGYRLVQEALSGAREDGGAASAEVVVRYAPAAVEVEVRDDGGTRGLLGLRERVVLYGGEVQAGPGRDGGHAVTARLPVEAPA